MKSFRVCAAILAAAVVTAPAFAGMFGGGVGQQDLGTEKLLEIFGKLKAFSATAHTSVPGRKDTDPGIETTMDFAYLDGNARTDVDMTKMKGGSMPPEVVAQMQSMGMDRVSHLFRRDEKLHYIIYPGMKAYCELTPPDLTGKTNAPPKLEKTEIGKETVDGHPCVKSKIVLTYDDGRVVEMFAWQARDLKDFPIKSEVTTKHGVITTIFQDIKLSPPDSSLFTLPSDFTRYGSMQEMMMANMSRFMPPGAPIGRPEGRPQRPGRPHDE